MIETVYLYALGANFCFSLGSQGFTYFAQKFGPLWMNALKASVAIVFFFLTILLGGQGFTEISLFGLLALFLSGSLGLAIGDIFLLGAMKEMGPGRTMLIFGFQPLLVGALSYLFFGQEIDTQKLWAIIFFIGCLLIISLECFKGHGHWQLGGIAQAFTGMLFDGTGIVITRTVFNAHPLLSPQESNFYRCLGALTFFVLYSQFRPIGLFKGLQSLSVKERLLAFAAPFLGTFVSLSFFLKAVQTANLAGLTGISITGTVFSALFESIIHKRWPSLYFYCAFICFLIGMKFLLF